MVTPAWSLRPATYDDAPLLASIVLAATKDQGLWPAETSAAEEEEWLQGFTRWSRESVDEPGTLEVIEVDGVPIGRLRTERDAVTVGGRGTPRVALRGLQLLPAHQGQGIGTSIIRALQSEVSAAPGVLDLGVEHANSGARRLYDRLGFIPTGKSDKEVQLRWTPGTSTHW